MRTSRTLCLPLVISLLLLSCSPAAKVGKVEPEESSPEPKFAPLGDGCETLLFKAHIELFKEHYSGLFLIKSLPDSSTHVVFLSELGLNYMDLKYKDDQFEVVSVQEFLNRPPILKTLKSDFRTLLLDLSAIGSYSLTETIEEGKPVELLEFKHRKEKYLYFHSEEKGTYRIQRRKGLFKRVDFSIGHHRGLGIEIAHKSIKLNIKLQQLNQLSDYVYE